MKHFSLATLAAISLALAGLNACSQFEADFASIDTENATRTGIDHALSRLGPVQVITALPEDDPTKTVLQDPESSSILWTEGDAINVFYAGRQARFEATVIDGTRADFEGQLGVEPDGTQDIWALYPYDAEATCQDGVILTHIPENQTATSGSFPEDVFLSIATSKSLAMTFKNICSGVKFSVSRDDITSVTFAGKNGEPLAGSFLVTLRDGEPVIEGIEEPVSSVTLSAPDGQCLQPDTWYYLVTLPAALENGFTLTVESAADKGCVPSSAAFNLNRNHFRKASLIDARVDIPTLSLDIENAKARKYLDNVDYSDDLGGMSGTGGYTRSDFSYWTNQASLPSGMQGYWPNPVTFTWTSRKQRTLRVATQADFSDVAEYTVSSSAATTEIFNLVPGKTYYYQVLSADGTVLYTSTFSPVGPERMIKASSDPMNFRDLGGWVGEGGKTMVYERLYRGTEIGSSNASAARSLFSDLNITVDLDLRGNGSGTARDVLNFGSNYLNLKVYQFMYRSGQSAGYTQELYQDALRAVIGWLDEGRNIYFHCIGGADRTGTLAFLIQALLGVSENDMSKEYELTSFYRTRLRNDNSERPFRQLVWYLKTFEGDTMQEKVTNWAMTRHSSSSTPLTEDEIATLKRIMLE